jgi:bifunctional non-homologous end joining protein LigD
VPIAWDELDALSGAAHWTVRNVASRIAVGNTPWAAYRGARQGLAAAMKALGFDPKSEATWQRA